MTNDEWTNLYGIASAIFTFLWLSCWLSAIWSSYKIELFLTGVIFFYLAVCYGRAKAAEDKQ